MATVNLLPNADISNNFTISTGSDAYAVMDDDHTGSIASDSSFLSATAVNKKFSLGFQDFSESASSIDGVQAVVKAGNNGRGAEFTIGMTIVNGAGGNFYSAESSGSLAASASYRTVTFTNRTTSDGSSAWTETDVNNLRMELQLTDHPGGTFRTTYCYYIITYTEAAVATDNSIFFGTNF